MYLHILIVHREDNAVCRLSSTVTIQLLVEPVVYGRAFIRLLILFRLNSYIKTHMNLRMSAMLV